ncbi:hypothetical protein [Mitsuokella jalaludinii]|uniref:hypothetical protein n=1 Tax=Mitsuokella jalaludinii TaxID=187979 RepID=UPI0012E1821A|nr:hypothetical protein [Mitsuokella jalaludinii]
MELLGEIMEASKSDKAENMSFASWLKMNHPKQAKQDIFSLKGWIYNLSATAPRQPN